MTKTFHARPFATGAIAFSAVTAMTSAAAIAACGGAPTLVALAGLVGPPSITATETSTDQALELIRKRREEQSGACPAGFTRSGGNCVPTGGAAQVASAQAAPPAPPPQAAAPPPQATVTTTTTTGPAPAAAAAPQPKRPVSRPAAKAQQQVAQAAPAAAPTAPVTRSAPPPAAASYGYGSIKDGGYPDVLVPGTVRAHGVWAELYYDHEKHENLNPGQIGNNPTRRLTSGGTVAGVDVSQYTIARQAHGWQLGVFSGYNTSRAKFTDTVGLKDQGALGTQLTLTTQQRQEFDGAFVGAYGSVVNGGWSADLAFKVDFFDITQRLTETLIGCGDVFFRENSTTMTNYVVASNLHYRFQLTPSFHLEPTVGVRHTHVDYGSNALALGVRDGDVFRVQGGLRLGTQFRTPDGWIWRTSLTGLLYSDVSISGLVAPSTNAAIPTVPLVDEGKLRAMAILDTRVDVGHGYTLYSDLEVRGGEDVFGFGARAGVRYQW